MVLGMSSEESLDVLEPRLQEYVKKAHRALEEGRPDYTIDVCMSVLNRHPGCAVVRQLLYDARKCVPSLGSLTFVGGLWQAFHFLCIASAALFVKRRPLRVLAIVESALCDVPGHPFMFRLLGQAAEVLGLPRTARIAYRALLGSEPESPANAVALGNACLACMDPHEALELGRRAVRLDPAHRDAQELVKKAAVELSLGNRVRP